MKALFFLLCSFLLAPPAQAYVDPGTGAYLVQALLALAGALMFYLRHPRQLLKWLWSKLTNKRRDD